MTLERISFKKGREHQPRLSAPYVPGQRAKFNWTEAENEILRQHYPSKGTSYCMHKLPGRSQTSVYGQAHKLGLKRDGVTKRHDHTREELAALDAKISELWPTMEIPKGDMNGVKEIARRLGVERWLISKRCMRLGLTRPRRKEPDWSAAEEDLMRRVPLHDPDKCSEIFRAHGFNRTPTAIVVKSKRLNLKRRYTETLSARTAAKILGLDNKTVTIYCLKGIIKSGRRKTKRLSQQGGDPHSIDRADLRQFIVDNLELIDFRKVDKFSIVDLLVNAGFSPQADAAGSESVTSGTP